MSLKRRVSLDFKRRNEFSKFELDKICFSFFINTNLLKNKTRYLYQFVLYNKGLNNKNITKIINRCIWTGKTKWVLRRFKLSRMSIKNAAAKGLLMGTRKAKW